MGQMKARTVTKDDQNEKGICFLIHEKNYVGGRSKCMMGNLTLRKQKGTL